MDSNWTRRRLLIGSLLVLGGCTRDYGSSRNAPTAAPTRPAPGPTPPVAGPIAPPPDAPLPLPEPDIPPPAPGRYVLVPRSSWAKAPIRSNNQPMNGVSRITIHHTGEYAAWADIPDVEVVRRIDRYHREDRRWCAIGYHYLVGKDGRVYEGRPVQYQGAHTLSANEHNLGISVIGDFREKLPNSAQLAALAKFLDDQRIRFRVGKARVYGHRDLHKSICPGNALYAWLRKYKI
jgi:hypothetical protein